MSRADFYDMTPGEFWEAMAAHQKEVESERRHQGELARGAALRLFNIQLRSKDQIKDPRDFWPMPWDEEKDKNKENQKELERLESLSDTERHQTAQAFLQKIGWK